MESIKISASLKLKNMKQITIAILLVFVSLMAFTQTKFPVGVYAEGGYFFPKNDYNQDIENKLATGGGVFVGYNFLPKFSASLQAGYRFKSNNATSMVFPDDGFGGYGHEYETINHTYKQHYFVLPIKINYLLSEKLFVEAGIETAWILNYDKIKKGGISIEGNADYINFVNKNPEFDWIIGFGYKLSPK